MATGRSGEPGKPGQPGSAGGPGGAGGVGGEPSGTGGAGGAGGAGGPLGGDYAAGRRRFRLLVMGSLVLSALSILLASYLFARIMSEGRERRDQTCRITEGNHETAVNDLKRTYAFLDSLPRSDYGTPLTVAVISGLPADEAAVRGERRAADGRVTRGRPVQPFCNEEGIGLPEPDPEIPPKRDFSALLKRP